MSSERCFRKKSIAEGPERLFPGLVEANFLQSMKLWDHSLTLQVIDGLYRGLMLMFSNCN